MIRFWSFHPVMMMAGSRRWPEETGPATSTVTNHRPPPRPPPKIRLTTSAITTLIKAQKGHRLLSASHRSLRLPLFFNPRLSPKKGNLFWDPILNPSSDYQKRRNEMVSYLRLLFLYSIIQHLTVLPSSALVDKSSNQSLNSVNVNKMSLDEQCQRLVKKLRPKIGQQQRQEEDNQQYWIGLGGGPGSGKTTVANRIANLLNSQVAEEETCIVIPMDGWHIPQKELLKKYGQENGMNRRGAPYTFDVDQLYHDLKKAKDLGEASLPQYCREISDPVPDAVRLKPSHRIVIVEGIYLLWKDDSDWNQLQELWDEKWFIQCTSEEEQVNRLVQRSVRTWTPTKAQIWGDGVIGARKRVELNDIPNMLTVQHCHQYADEVIIND